MDSIRLRTAHAILFALASGPVLAADGSLPIDVPFPREKVSGQVCGLLCVREAFRAMGLVSPDLSDLLLPSYFSDDDLRGSTADDLCRALADHGLTGIPVENMSLSTLRLCKDPVILHTADPMTGRGYLHWVLYLGEEDGLLRIADPPSPAGKFKPAEFMASWDGSGIVVSAAPVSLASFQVAWICAEVLPVVGITLLLLVSVHAISRCYRGNNKQRHWLLASVVALALPTMVISAVRHYLMSDGMFVDGSGLRVVRQMHSSGHYTEITTVSELRGLLARYSIVLIDARFPRDYAIDHLPGSVNIPVYATRTERRQVLRSVNPTDHIVVYCQSSRCVFSDRVADSLIADGLNSVSVFRPGWISWRENQQ